MTRALVLVTVAFALWPWARPGAEAQMMMGDGGNRGAGREAKSERLANVTPEQRAYLEALREESEGATAHRVTLRAGTTRYTSGPSEISAVRRHESDSLSGRAPSGALSTLFRQA